jgi:hypothetical protein
MVYCGEFSRVKSEQQTKSAPKKGKKAGSILIKRFADVCGGPIFFK